MNLIPTIFHKVLIKIFFNVLIDLKGRVRWTKSKDSSIFWFIPKVKVIVPEID